ADDTVRLAITHSTEAEAIKAVLGVTTLLPVRPSHAEVEQAIDDAELRPEHWTTLLDFELDKTRVPLPKVSRQHRNQVHMIAHRAQQAAARREHKDTAAQTPKSLTAAQFMLAVWTGLQHQTYFKVFYPTLSNKMRAGTPITVEDV